MIKKYKKKPVIIDALKFDRHPNEDFNGKTIISILEEMGANTEDYIFSPDAINIPTLEGVMRAEIGDFIIKGVAGEFYPCKPDIFKKTYEEIS